MAQSPTGHDQIGPKDFKGHEYHGYLYHVQARSFLTKTTRRGLAVPHKIQSGPPALQMAKFRSAFEEQNRSITRISTQDPHRDDRTGVGITACLRLKKNTYTHRKYSRFTTRSGTFYTKQLSCVARDNQQPTTFEGVFRSDSQTVAKKSSEKVW